MPAPDLPDPPHRPVLSLAAPPRPAAGGPRPRRWLVAGALALVAALLVLAGLVAAPRDHAGRAPPPPDDSRHDHPPDVAGRAAPWLRQDPPGPDFAQLGDPGFRVIPLHEAARIAQGRFRGRLIAARLAPPTEAERARGVDLVHELRLLTPARDVLLIRLDARDGAFLEVRGAGLARARRLAPGHAAGPAPAVLPALPARAGDPR